MLFFLVFTFISLGYLDGVSGELAKRTTVLLLHVSSAPESRRRRKQIDTLMKNEGIHEME